MSKTQISWTDYTWNPMKGCTKESDGCVNCYAEENAHRWKTILILRRIGISSGSRFSHTYWTSLSRYARRNSYFSAAMSDVFHEEAPLDYIQMVFDRMARCPHHIFQVS